MLKQLFDFALKKMIETMDRLAVNQGREIVETTVRFSSLENDWKYGYIP